MRQSSGGLRRFGSRALIPVDDFGLLVQVVVVFRPVDYCGSKSTRGKPRKFEMEQNLEFNPPPGSAATSIVASAGRNFCVPLGLL